MSNRLYLYKTYVFRTRDPVIEEARAIVASSGLSNKQVNQASGVSTATLRAWFGKRAKTKRPQFATVNAVARACGKTLTFTDWKGPSK